MKYLRTVGWLLLVPGALTAALLGMLSVMTQWQTASMLTIGMATFIPMLWLPCTVAIVGLALVLTHWWRLLAVALAVAALVGWGLPILQPDPGVAQDQRAPDLSVVSLNVQYGRADVEDLATHLGPAVDLVAIQEYTPAFGQRLREAGLLDEFPHQVGSQREDAGGTMLLSRTPAEIVAEADTLFDNFVARVDVRGVTWHVGVIHSTPPQLGAEVWAEDGYRVNGLALQFVEERLVLVGDFNAVDDHHTMRILTKGPIRNAMANTSGMAAWQPTWPVGGRLPPFARIDHFLASDRVKTSAPERFEVSGTDHAGILAQAWLDPDDSGD